MAKTNVKYLKENNLYEAHKHFMRLSEAYIPTSFPEEDLEEAGEDQNQDPNAMGGQDPMMGGDPNAMGAVQTQMQELTQWQTKLEAQIWVEKTLWLMLVVI